MNMDNKGYPICSKCMEFYSMNVNSSDEKGNLVNATRIQLKANEDIFVLEFCFKYKVFYYKGF